MAHIPVYLQIKTGNLIFHSTYQYILVKGLCDYIKKPCTVLNENNMIVLTPLHKT